VIRLGADEKNFQKKKRVCGSYKVGVRKQQSRVQVSVFGVGGGEWTRGGGGSAPNELDS